MKHWAVLAICGLGTMGCGGDSNLLIVEDPSGLTTPEYSSSVEIVSESGDLGDQVAALGATDPTTVPAAGTANYEGTMIILTDNPTTSVDPSVAGGLALEIQFAESAKDTVVRGIADNFFVPSGASVDGTLVVTEARDLSSSGLDISLEGTLDVEDVDFAYRVDMVQTFSGDGVAALDGLGGATATEVDTGVAQNLVATSALVRQ